MRIAITNILLFLLLFLQSCSLSTNQKMEQAEELIESNPTEALVMLEALLPDYSEMSDKEKAFFGLLYFQALDKNDLELSPLEKINFSIKYYSQKDDKYHLAYAYLYKSRMYRYHNQDSEAATLLLQAIEHAKNTKKNNESLLGKIYFDLGFISYQQKEYEKANEYYEISVQYFEQADEKDNLAYTFLGIGQVYHCLKKHDDALSYYNKSLNISTDSILFGTTLLDIANCYYSLRQLDSALYYTYESLKYPYYSVNQAMRYFTLADIYFDLKQYDSASHYAKKSLEYPSNHYIKRESYRVLGNVANIHNKKDSTKFYFDNYQACFDSIIKIESQPKITIIENLHQLNLEANKAKRSKSYYIVGIIAVIIAGAAIFYFAYKYNKQIQKKKAEQYQAKLESKQTILQQELVSNKINDMQRQYAKDKKAGNVKEDYLQVNRLIYDKVLNVHDKKAFFAKMNSIFNNMPDKLEREYPALAYNDIVWCCLYLLNIPTADIALILDCKKDSIYTLKQRILKKVGLSTTKELKAFLQEMSK
ncbi:tetratricopeptide repeat protein [Paludibacter sp. 221]|uniref:tetratricopeptide repeat protein n=1 Tax=Paludibacter sp. 221 TaxID=2302939 RepID=UPI0013D82A25|nr:tetratricopeptide repeat protein [Paludibacter sp. 221]NDV46849.1 tetratricopeptide repeat protein [Paludibacter sp. 221]